MSVFAYLDVEPHGVWGMDECLCGAVLGLGERGAIPRAAQTARVVSDKRASSSKKNISRITKISRLEESWKSFRDNVCVHKGFPPPLTAFRAIRGSRMAVGNFDEHEHDE